MEQLHVRQMPDSFVSLAPSPTIREVDAPLVCRTDVRSRHVNVEWMRRRGAGPVRWRYRQDRHAIFCFERGIKSCVGIIDGGIVGGSLDGAANLAFLAAGSLAEVVFDVPAECSYLVVSFDTAAFMMEDEDVLRMGTPESQVGFSDRTLGLAVGQLRRELAHTDALSRLMVESWAAQAWGLLHRRRASNTRIGRSLGSKTLEKALSCMRERLADGVSLAELASLVSLSPRQFCRRFQAATGSTPARTMDAMRLDLASTLLATTRRSVTDIALDCGFSQPQHLATAFKRRFSTTPTAFRTAIT